MVRKKFFIQFVKVLAPKNKRVGKHVKTNKDFNYNKARVWTDA